MKGKALVAAVGLALAGCGDSCGDRPDPISDQDLVTFAGAHPDCERMELDKLSMILATIEGASQFKATTGKEYLDLRDLAQRRAYADEGFYQYQASLEEDGGVLITWHDPTLEKSQKEAPYFCCYLHDRLYRIVIDESSGRKILKIEAGNLVRSGEGDSDASLTTKIDAETGVVLASDDGPGPFSNRGFSLAHDRKTGQLIRRAERGYQPMARDAIQSLATSDMEAVARKMQEETLPVRDVSKQVRQRIEGL